MWPSGLYNLPIPGYTEQHIGPDEYDDQQFLSRAQTQLTWSLVPRRCHVSGRWMWLTHAYCADYIISGPGDPAVWTRWYSREEMLVLKLKGY
jgi:hypothetical protein